MNNLRIEKGKKNVCFICGKKDHWAAKCLERKSRPRLAALCANLDPAWWDMYEVSKDFPPPFGGFLYLPDSDYSIDSCTDSDIPIIAKCDQLSSSEFASESD